MGRDDAPSERHDPLTPDAGHAGTGPQGDPWVAFGRLVAGVLVYGLAGWGLDRWLGTHVLVAVGILFGATLGLYLTWTAYRVPPEGGDQ